MVKGTNRQVIVVKSPDPKLFEEAIFLVREDAMSSAGTTPDQVIRQARQAADGYLRRSTAPDGDRGGLPGLVWGLLGALLASLAWAAGVFLL